MLSDRALMWIQLGLELPFIALHVLVLACVLLGIRRKEPALASTFFKTYCVQSVAEIANYFLVRSRARLDMDLWLSGRTTNLRKLFTLLFSNSAYLKKEYLFSSEKIFAERVFYF
jgi:hypothetical protein